MCEFIQMHVCINVINIRGLPPLFSTLLLRVSYWYWNSSTLASLDTQVYPEMPSLLPPSLLGFHAGDEESILVLMLVWQTLYPLSHFPSPAICNFLYLSFCSFANVISFILTPKASFLSLIHFLRSKVCLSVQKDWQTHCTLNAFLPWVEFNEGIQVFSKVLCGICCILLSSIMGKRTATWL